MENLKDLVEEFKGLNEEERILLASNQYAPPEIFKKIALAILNGCFEVKSNTNQDKIIWVIPTSVEIYYHEEKMGGVKDPIVYHRNNPKKGVKLPILASGILHNHVSGIDITFESGEDPETAIRASALIRAFKMEYGNPSNTNEIWGIKEEENRSTYIYAALFSQFSVFDGFSIKWVEGRSSYTIDKLLCAPRKNVKCFTEEHIDGKENFTKINYKADIREWQFKLS